MRDLRELLFGKKQEFRNVEPTITEKLSPDGKRKFTIKEWQPDEARFRFGYKHITLSVQLSNGRWYPMVEMKTDQIRVYHVAKKNSGMYGQGRTSMIYDADGRSDWGGNFYINDAAFLAEAQAMGFLLHNDGIPVVLDYEKTLETLEQQIELGEDFFMPKLYGIFYHDGAVVSNTERGEEILAFLVEDEWR